MVIHRPSFNVDTLEGAILHLLSVCHTIPDIAIACFAEQYAARKGKRLPASYTYDVLLPRLKKEHKIYNPAAHIYSLSPIIYYNENGITSFWVFLHLMKDVDIGNVFCGTPPAQLSYIKNNTVYHIVCCKSDGTEEMLYEVGAEKHAKMQKKYFFVFKSEEDINQAKLMINAPALFVLVKEGAPGTPATVKFYDPKSLGKAEKQQPSAQ